MVTLRGTDRTSAWTAGGSRSLKPGRCASLLAVLTFAVLAVAQPISAQVGCGDLVTADVTLTADLDCTGFTGTVLTVDADQITIDGQGHRIIAPDAGAMVSITGHTGVTIRNIDLSGSPIGISVTGGGGNTFTDVNVSWLGATPSGEGILLFNSTGNLIELSTVTNRESGIRIFRDSDGTTVQGNDLTGNSTAINGSGNFGQGHVISDNNLSNAAVWAITMRDDDLLQITGDNIFHGSANGIDLAAVDGLMLSDLDLSQVPGLGLRLGGVTNSTFSRVAASGSPVGISVTGGGGNTFTDVNVSWLGVTPSGEGILLFNSTGNLIEGSTVTNRATGFDLRGDNQRVECSWITDNTVGVEVRSGFMGISVTMNHIEGNSLAGVRNNGTAVVDAQVNFWGAANGPSPPGSGDAVVGIINADPFFTTVAEADDACGRIQLPVADAGPDQTGLVGVPVSLDGSGSSSPNGIIVLYEWDFGDGSSPAFLGQTVDHVYDSPGVFVVTLTVTDIFVLTDTDTATITVMTASEGIAELTLLVESLDLASGVENSLLAKLHAAQSSAEGGNGNAAIGQLGAFINEVGALSGNQIPQGAAAALIAQAQAIIASLQSGG